MKETHLFLTEGYVLNFLDELGYEGVLKKKKDEMYSDIRSLNNENRELRRQLGEKVSNEDVREKLKNISNIIKNGGIYTDLDTLVIFHIQSMER